MRKKPTADKGYAKRRAAGDDGWDGPESAYAPRKAAIEKSLARLKAPKPLRLLELGCGAGNLTLWFAAKGYEAYGVDLSATAIEWAREKNAAAKAKASFSVGDVTDLAAFGDGFFDIVIDGHCLHWLEGDDRRRTLASARRVLRAGGLLLVCSQCGEPKTLDQMKKDGMVYDPVRRVVLNKHGLVAAYFGTPESIVAEVKSAGFTVLDWEVFPAPDGDDLHVEAARRKRGQEPFVPSTRRAVPAKGS